MHLTVRRYPQVRHCTAHKRLRTNSQALKSAAVITYGGSLNSLSSLFMEQNELVMGERGGLLSFGILAALWTSSSALTAISIP
jgi:hypothetical protein